MTEVKIYDWSPIKIIDTVSDMRKNGFVQHVDFDFEYHPPVYDSFTGNTVDKFVIFRFYTDKLASWFTLKWG
jgi:hypothetical protein